jgi:hypothetical protein
VNWKLDKLFFLGLLAMLPTRANFSVLLALVALPLQAILFGLCVVLILGVTIGRYFGLQIRLRIAS